MNLLQGVIDWFGDPNNWSGVNGVWNRLFEHLALTAAGLGLACAVILPIAVVLGHLGKAESFAVNLTNVGRAVPTYAVLVLLVMGPLGVSTWSTVLALALFAAPPLMTSTFVGLREVDRDVVDAARGSGMSGVQVLRRVELPLATPAIMGGVRLAAVQVVATATIAALVAGGGLGRIINQGFADQNMPQLVAGAILVAGLALVIEGVALLAQRLVDPLARATSGKQHTKAPTSGPLAEVPV